MRRNSTGTEVTAIDSDQQVVAPAKKGFWQTSSPSEKREKNQQVEQHVSEANAGGRPGDVEDAVWGTVGADGPNYRNLGWIRASVLEVKTQIGLGVLGLPAVLGTLGYAGGLLTIMTVALIITWSDYVIGTFKRNHPEVYSVADVGHIFFGKVGREIWGGVYWLMLTAISGAGMLSFGVALNSITNHATCTVAWVVVAAVITGGISSIQTLDRISWLGWVGLVGIMASVITVTVAVGVEERPFAAPATGPVDLGITIGAGSASFIECINAVNIVIFAYAGTPCFFNIVGEMRDTKNYTKSVIACQTYVTTVYMVIGATVYHFVGRYIASPALGSAGPLMEKISYGLAIPSLIVNAVLNCHMPAKYIFVRLLSGSTHLARNTPTHYMVWYGCIVFNCAISFIIAEAIPIFNDLLSLIGALFGSFLCISTEPAMWLYDNFRLKRTVQWWFLTSLNVLFVLLGAFMMVAGTYGAVEVIKADLGGGKASQPFSCADSSKE